VFGPDCVATCLQDRGEVALSWAYDLVWRWETQVTHTSEIQAIWVFPRRSAVISPKKWISLWPLTQEIPRGKAGQEQMRNFQLELEFHIIPKNINYIVKPTWCPALSRMLFWEKIVSCWFSVWWSKPNAINVAFGDDFANHLWQCLNLLLD